MQQTMSLEIAVLRSVDALSLVVIARVKVGTDIARLAKSGEVSLWIDRRGTVTWNEKYIAPVTTDINGQVGWTSTAWPNDRFRLVAQHIASGAMVHKIFEVGDNVVTLEEPQVQVNPGTPMPVTFKQEIRHLSTAKRYPGYGYANIR